MEGIKTRLKRVQKLVERMEHENREALINRIRKLGYSPDEVITTLPLEHSATRARLMVVLEYEELAAAASMMLITEPQFACCFYPQVVLNYIDYVLDEVGAPPVAEIGLYKVWILDNNPGYAADFNRIEHKWRLCAAASDMND